VQEIPECRYFWLYQLKKLSLKLRALRHGAEADVMEVIG